MPTTEALVQQYLDERVARRDLDPMTARNHRSTLNQFAKEVGADPTAITSRDVERWLATRTHVAQSTRRTQFSNVKTFCAWLRLRGYLDRNPALEVPSPRTARSVPRALPVEWVGALIEACPDARARAIVRLMVNMGLRCVEVHRLEVGDWDRSRNTMRITGKFGHERLLPVPAEVAVAVDEYLDEHPAGAGPLIRSYRRPGLPVAPATLSGMVSEWMRAARIKRVARNGVSAHALRHTAASDVLDECKDLRVVQLMLGHQNLSTTAIYLRSANLDELRIAMAGRRYEPGGDVA